MRLQIIVLFYVLFLSGCSMLVYDDSDIYKYIPVSNTRIYSHKNTISIVPPNYDNTPFEMRVRLDGRNPFDQNYIVLRRIVKNKIVEKMRLSVERITEFNSDLYLNRDNVEKFRIATENTNGKFEFMYRNSNKNPVSFIFEEAFVTYIDGMQCRTFKEREHEYGSSTKTRTILTQSYKTYCSFYDEKSEPKTLMIYYSSNYLRGSNVADEFEKDMKNIFPTIKIKMNREKMKKEGLLFEKPRNVKYW
ncbi:hypothetical protein [Campylobacter mucosalis]|uniref:Lipoprotein n=1 Tax=Campylobacter mucosalis CCUG 21559 TaxID=1032067 RepID=A0A6G5QJ05_9BACT|nr:hypothetical protein [Campylobacter mucosalis]QCD45675.1 hypothetical protein CMUC_1934 [Campylobacter mucosalis CCUG 21559]